MRFCVKIRHDFEDVRKLFKIALNEFQPYPRIDHIPVSTHTHTHRNHPMSFPHTLHAEALRVLREQPVRAAGCFPWTPGEVQRLSPEGFLACVESWRQEIAARRTTLEHRLAALGGGPLWDTLDRHSSTCAIMAYLAHGDTTDKDRAFIAALLEVDQAYKVAHDVADAELPAILGRRHLSPEQLRMWLHPDSRYALHPANIPGVLPTEFKTEYAQTIWQTRFDEIQSDLRAIQEGTALLCAITTKVEKLCAPPRSTRPKRKTCREASPPAPASKRAGLRCNRF